MAERPSPNPEDLKDLYSQILALEISKLRREEKPERDAKPDRWGQFLQSNLAVALVTVVLGTIGGAVVANKVQENARISDQTRAQQLSDLEQERKAFNEAFTVLGKTLAASQNLITISGKDFDPAQKDLKPEQQKYLQGQRENTLKAYSTTLGEWQVQEVRLGIVLAALHSDPATVYALWDDVSRSVDKFNDCAMTKAYEYSPLNDDDLKTKCQSERKEAFDALSKLSKLLFARNATPQHKGFMDICKH